MAHIIIFGHKNDSTFNIDKPMLDSATVSFYVILDSIIHSEEKTEAYVCIVIIH